MTKPKLKAQSQTREFSGHHMLLHAANLLAEKASFEEEGRFNHCLAAMTMSSLAVEALLNAVGKRSVPDWGTFERANPGEKIRQLHGVLNFSYDPKVQPWETLRTIGKFRNSIAHVKPEPVSEVRHFSDPAPPDILFARPLSKIEREITVGNARRYVDAVQSLKRILCDALPVGRRSGIYVDSWGGSTTNVEDV